MSGVLRVDFLFYSKLNKGNKVDNMSSVLRDECLLYSELTQADKVDTHEQFVKGLIPLIL